jgi:hypothetical protein
MKCDEDDIMGKREENRAHEKRAFPYRMALMDGQVEQLFEIFKRRF